MISAILSITMDFKGKGIATLGEFNNALPKPSLPPLSFGSASRMMSSAILITIVGFIESQTVTRHFGLKNGYFPSGDREFFALGASNVFGSFFGAYVTFGSLPRSRIQATSGGKTTFVGAMAALIVLGLTIGLSGFLKFLPKPTMAAIVMNAAINLIEYEEIGYLFQMQNLFEILLFIATWALTMFVSINEGIVFCIGLSALLILRKTTMVNIGLLGKLRYSSHEGNQVKTAYVDIRDYPEAELMDGIMAISIQNNLEFYNAGRLRRRIEMLLEVEADIMNNKRDSSSSGKSVDLKKKRQSAFFVDSGVKIRDLQLTLVLDFSKCESIDSNATFILHKIFKSMLRQNARCIISGLRPEMREMLSRGHIIDQIGKENVVESIQDAIRLSNMYTI